MDESRTSRTYPILNICGVVRLPALTIPIAFAVLCCFVGRRAWRNPSHTGLFKRILQASLTVLHSVLYLQHVWFLLGDISTAHNPDICLLGFVSLVFGDADLEQARLRLSVLTATGWVFALGGFPDLPFQGFTLTSLVFRIYTPFILAIPCAW